jgi:hypothetical protein
VYPLGVIVSEPIQKQNHKHNQSKPKIANTAFDLDEFQWIFFTKPHGSVWLAVFISENRAKPQY